MSVASFKRNIRSSKTRLANIIAGDHNLGLADGLVGEAKLNAIRAKITNIKTELGRVKRAMSNLKEWQSEYVRWIDELDDADQPDAEAEQAQFYVDEALADLKDRSENLIDELEGRITELRDELELVRVGDRVPNRNRGARAGEDNAVEHVNVKYEDIPIDTFYGDYVKWSSWWQQYNNNFHSKPMPSITKFRYLRKYTKGRAKRAIEGLSETAENYENAVNTLKSRFGNKVLIINAINVELLMLPKPADRVGDVRRFLEKVEAYIHTLVSLEDEEEDKRAVTKNKQTEVSIERRLPEKYLERVVEARLADPEWDVIKLIKKLQDILQLKENAKDIGGSEYRPSSSFSQNSYGARDNHRVNFNNKRRDSNFRYNVYAAVDKSNQATVKRNTCILCDSDGHFSSNCKKFQTFGVRSQRLQAKGFCTRCIKRGHKFSECREAIICASECKCKVSGHHAIFCRTNRRSPPSAFTRQSKSPESTFRFPQKTVKFNECEKQKSTANGQNERIPFRRPSGNVVSPVVHQNKKIFAAVANNSASINELEGNESSDILLMFARARVENPAKQNLGEKVTAFLDVGSSFSFIRTDFAQKLKLKLCKQVKREIAVFGDSVPKSRIYNVYELNLVQTDQTRKKILVYGTDELMLEALTLTNVMERAIDENILELNKDDVKVPSLLIGADYFWEIVGGPIEQLPSGFWLVDSSLGMIVSGKGKIHGGSGTKLAAEIEDVTKISSNAAQDLQNIWGLESIGISDDPNVNDEEVATNLFLKNIRWDQKEKRYFVKWPWKESINNLASNKGLAYGRLESTLRKLQINKDALAAYEKKFR